MKNSSAKIQNKYLNTFQFSEYHEIRIEKEANYIFPVIKNINFKKSKLISFLFTIRGLPKKMDTINGFVEKGFRGYPIATIAYYGPNDKNATKVTVGIVPHENAEPSLLKRWFNEDTDIRKDRITNKEIIEFIKENEAKSG